MKVVYNSFNGRFSDNPRAIYEALLAARGGRDDHTWLADPTYASTFPDGVQTAPFDSPAGFAAMEAADVVIGNCHMGLHQWDIRPDTMYLQTWHGTPLKRIHRAAAAHPGSEIMDRLDHDISRWDYLITPSRAGTELLRAAFDYTGAVLETGYPRNDPLSAPDRTERRESIRAALGLAPMTRAVLYAPTYRDDDVDERDVPYALDPTALTERLGPDHHLLLRRHYFLGHREDFAASDRVLDVSRHVDIADLYLAADVLVTDYSSVLFDFAVTGRPIVIFAPDLEHYRDRLRGFTLDLDLDLPGPIVRTQADLEAALLSLDDVNAQFATRYDAFRERYCHLDDGHASERVLAQLGWV